MTGSAIRCLYSDPDLNRLLASASASGRSFTRHYNQVEEFFLRVEGEFAVPQLPIHHDVRRPAPEESYRGLLREVLDQLVEMVPQVLQGLTHLFDPADTLRPAFFSLYRIEERRYLYMLRLDLSYRPQIHRVLHKGGGNDFTPAYSTNQLFLEATVVPLLEVAGRNGKVEELRIDQTISETWVDETGRGYFVQGIWIDNDLTRFFSKLFTPPQARLYPFFPFTCRYKTVCKSVIHLDPGGRQQDVPLLQRALDFLRPSLPEIEASMKSGDFSESNPVFRKLKARVPQDWHQTWEGLSMDRYLNDQDMREFRIDESPA
jgi:hypothetical protein